MRDMGRGMTETKHEIRKVAKMSYFEHEMVRAYIDVEWKNCFVPFSKNGFRENENTSKSGGISVNRERHLL